MSTQCMDQGISDWMGKPAVDDSGVDGGISRIVGRVSIYSVGLDTTDIILCFDQRLRSTLQFNLPYLSAASRWILDDESRFGRVRLPKL